LITDDTIVAISSAAGSGERTIVRLSGERALELAGGMFENQGLRPISSAESVSVPDFPGDKQRRHATLAEIGSFRCVDGVVNFLAGENLPISLPCRVYVFRAPRSFTRQDVVELHIPGSVPAACALVDHLARAGARRAQAGEFTARAFFSGRIDLSAAQAVADVIDAASDAQLRSAMSALGGRLARLCAKVAGELAEALATTEASIDLAEEHIELDSPRELSRRLGLASEDLRRLAAQARDMPEQAHLPRVVLCGRPNAGKSSLLNALAGFDRAIISPVAGTTRDVLGATIILEGSAVLLQDAAGLVTPPASRDWKGAVFPGHPQEDLGVPQQPGGVFSLDQAAQVAARAAIDAADVLLPVADLTDAADLAGLAQQVDSWRAINRRAPVLLLANKADLLTQTEIAARVGKFQAALNVPVVVTSAATGRGLAELRRELANLLQLSAPRGAEALGLHQWQRQCIVDAQHAAARAGDLLAASAQVADQAELVAVELRTALANLGQISGQIVTEDILGRIFARFCVGK
jgi:tRNA modification GTPase